jgi:NAD(P)-dependent dehydrogenase (short-subunit alcohol dehydrogenase family)
MPQFENKVVLVTGAGKGTGRKLAEAFAAHGAKVAANDVSPVNVEQVVAGITGQGGQARAFVEDIAKKVGVQALVNAVLEAWGRIDILINQANVEPVMPLLEMDEWDWHRVLDVNLTGAFLLTQSVGRVMRAQGGGIILNLIPLAGHTETGHAAYAASKLGLLGLTRLAAEELAPYGIRVHAVGTGLTEAARAENQAGETVATVLSLCEPSQPPRIVTLK